MGVQDLLQEARLLSAEERKELIKLLVDSLTVTVQNSTATDWHTFLRETYGSMRDTPIQRWDEMSDGYQ